MIAEPPSALALFFRRLMDAREARKRPHHSGTVDGGKLVAEVEQRALPAPKQRPLQATALSPSPRPVLPPGDILAMPDRDDLRVVVPDYDHLQYGD